MFSFAQIEFEHPGLKILLNSNQIFIPGLFIHQVVNWIHNMYMNKKNVLKKLFQTKIKCNFIRDITLFWITFMQAYSAIGNLIKCIAISVIMFTLQSKVIGLDYFMLLLSFFYNKNRFTNYWGSMLYLSNTLLLGIYFFKLTRSSN